jgi:hypothetical protein
MKGKKGSDTMDTVLNLGLAIGTGTVAKMGIEALGESVDFMKNSKLASAGIKLGLSIGGALMFPEILESPIGTGAAIGIGASGLEDAYNYVKTEMGVGFINHTRFTQPNVAGNGGVKVNQ